jgi:hypothetical protein
MQGTPQRDRRRQSLKCTFNQPPRSAARNTPPSKGGETLVYPNFFKIKDHLTEEIEKIQIKPEGLI